MTFSWRGVGFVLGISVVGCGGTKEASAPASAEEHKGFMTACVKHEDLRSYCECSFEYIVQHVPAVERAKEKSPQIDQAVTELPGACGAKIPEGYRRTQFIEECSEEAPMVHYCGCAFDFLKARGLLDKGEGEIATQASDLAENCASALLADSRDQFIQGCRQKQSPELCSCIFENLRSTFGSRELLVVFEKEHDKLGPAVKNAQASCTTP